MDKEHLEEFRELLRGQLKELMTDAEKTVIGMTDTDEEHYPDPTDRAAHETDLNFTLRVKDRERKLVTKVKDTLKQIDDGYYGICELCDGEISIERLRVRPVTTFCIECKTEAEEDEKMNR